jgi:small conductance mechanosensitive channel
MDTIQIDQIIEQLTKLAVDYGPKLIGAIVVLIFGGWIIRLIMRGFRKMMDRSKLEGTLKPFLNSLIRIILRILLIISVLGMVGVEMTSFIAILGAAGLAIGLALSGTLQNFAGGVIILLIKPFKVGDVIETQGYIGLVKEIQIFNTYLKSGDNKIIIIPNGVLVNSSLTNYSAEETRRLEWTFGISYGENVEKARKVIENIAEIDVRVLKDPAPFVAVSALADSSVTLIVRVWVAGTDYWGVNFDMNEKVYDAFNKEGISFPFPQLDVHMVK